VEETLETADRATGERILGIDPASGRTLLVRMSRFGPIVQIGKTEELEDGEKPRYGNLRPGQSIETLDMESALELFKLPKTLGQHKGSDVTIGIGRFGPYVKFGESFISLERGEDPLAVDMDRAIELIEMKKQADAPVGTYKGFPITKGKGRFGPFVKWNDMFVNIPRKYNPDSITLDEVYELIEAKVEKEANRYIHHWEDLKISVENGRWGPYIKFKKKNIKMSKVDGQKVTSETAKELSLEDIKKMIEAEVPDAFATKKKAKAKPKK
jgi:DNA topoisomerase-1